MSGHSKWASIKHKKKAVDAKRGKIFTKIIREITVAAKEGGGDINQNPRLRTAVWTAKSANMPMENIERAVKKGTGDLEGVNYEDVIYEGYGPQGVAIYVQCLTDNKNRASAEVRNIFSKNGGNMAGAGSVAWLFQKKGLIVIDEKTADEDQLMETVLNAGAEDLSKSDHGKFEVITDPQNLEAVKKALDNAKILYELSELHMIPKNMVSVNSAEGRKVMVLVEVLEDHDDVQNVYVNCDFPADLV